MMKNKLQYLRCIECNNDQFVLNRDKEILGKIKEGVIMCQSCQKEYKIVNYMPRFVSDEQYCENFGIEWNLHNTTQYDEYSGRSLSEERFFNETGWGRDLSGQIIIEAGCGSGRFTEWALKTNAVVLSFDLSNAAEANMKSNGDHANAFILQCSIFNIPFRKEIADKLFCFGVLQHTPNPKRTLFSLMPFVKDGGEIVFDIYKKKFHMKYVLRPFIEFVPPKSLYTFCVKWIDFMWPIATFFRKISPKYGPKINWQLMVADYSREGVPEKKLKDWAYLDTYDMLSPKYDKPASLKQVMEWMNELKDRNIIKRFAVKYGYNGIEGKIFK
jgi:2-polyprenyl-3-methyl-5-hydroxy-6-metoxy-1,4-benzoquinol methylase